MNNINNLEDSANKDDGIFKVKTPGNKQQEPYTETASRDNIKLFYKLGNVNGTGSFG